MDSPRRGAPVEPNAAQQTLLAAECLGIRFGRDESAVWAVADVTLEVVPGEMLAIVGASGSGKSTLLYAMAGLLEPSAGTVHSGGVTLGALDRHKLAQWRRDHVGFVFQNYNLVPYLNVRQNVELPARLAGRTPDTETALAAVELSERARSTPAELSGGQQQRVALARILAAPPPLVFADEPTGALDSISGAVVMSLLRALPSSRSAVVLVTHDLRAASLADRAVVMRDGRVVDELRAPTEASLFTAAEAA
ncbi:ABC transporter ATP-binding protein [Cellulosimicrobium cellulans]|uniref:ABC transporter ATP-binding protein n=1 Tax=Cellulosimicrobium cellulans TaxID=1710 RepID=UPI003800A299